MQRQITSISSRNLLLAVDSRQLSKMRTSRNPPTLVLAVLAALVSALLVTQVTAQTLPYCYNSPSYGYIPGSAVTASTTSTWSLMLGRSLLFPHFSQS